jgi:hypothetical protein
MVLNIVSLKYSWPVNYCLQCRKCEIKCLHFGKVTLINTVMLLCGKSFQQLLMSQVNNLIVYSDTSSWSLMEVFGNFCWGSIKVGWEEKWNVASVTSILWIWEYAFWIYCTGIQTGWWVSVVLKDTAWPWLATTWWTVPSLSTVQHMGPWSFNRVISQKLSQESR